MKIPRIVSMLVLAGFTAPAICLATVISTSTIEQPVNLGTRSDPTRIPLGGVPVLNNHGFSLHPKISAGRPCPDGAMLWEGGSELDQNLASVFGISVEADITLASRIPVTLRLKPWKPPVYSPYTKEQALAATLWCVLRAAGTPKEPLEVVVMAEGADDKPLEAKYSGKYVLPTNWKEDVVCPVKVPGTALEKDDRGFAWVVFPDVPQKDAFVPLSPSMIVTANRGESDNGWYFLPVWCNGNNGQKSSLQLNGWSIPMYYSSWLSKGVSEANSLLADGGLYDMKVTEENDTCHVELSYPKASQATLAASIRALVIATQPTEARPLVVSMKVHETGLSDFAPFRNLEEWSENHGNETVLTCEFVWDAKQQKLTKGSLPVLDMTSPGSISGSPAAGSAVAEKGGQTTKLPPPSQLEAQPETEPAAE
ncbi:MAG: hypothetical protein EOP88_13390 [Verrucomicrobiaceae bacterium]|nr:MAG: hypothetical protein EOP88_13390 [Verrucomicrobiaceae bacterium]